MNKPYFEKLTFAALFVLLSCQLTHHTSTKNENFHIPKWTGFFWYCTQIRHSNFAPLPTLDLKLIIIVMLLQLLVCSNDWLLSTMATMLATMLATAATFF